jgi:hypothetical protein
MRKILITLTVAMSYKIMGSTGGLQLQLKDFVDGRCLSCQISIPSRRGGPTTQIRTRISFRPDVPFLIDIYPDFDYDPNDEEKAMNKVVVRFADGRTLKGMTADFFPTKDLFHVNVSTDSAGAKPLEIKKSDLKALIFVKDLEGDPKHVESNEFDPAHPPAGRRIRVVFKDGEVLVGTTTGYQPGRPGFFLVPADSGSNMERCYVVTAATQEVSFL